MHHSKELEIAKQKQDINLIASCLNYTSAFTQRQIEAEASLIEKTIEKVLIHCSISQQWELY